MPKIFLFSAAVSDVREIGDVDEGVVEGGEDACDAEDELACEVNMLVCDGLLISCAGRLPTLADLRAEGDVLLRWALSLLLGRHVDGVCGLDVW